MEKETYFEMSRHRNLDSVNYYLFSERLNVIEVIKLEDQPEYEKSLLLTVKKEKK